MDVESSGMVAVPLESLVAGVQVPVDVYLSLNDSRFVLVFKAGVSMESNRIQEFNRRGLKQVYVRKDDYPQFFSRQFQVAGIIVNHPKSTSPQKIEFLHVAGELLLREFQLMGVTGESYDAAKSVAKSVIQLVGSQDSLLNLIANFNRSAPSTFNHSMGVGLMSVIIARAMSWTRPETLEKLALGGLLHDIGMQQLPPALVVKPRAEMTYEEIREYESHSFRGMQILQGLSFIPSELVAIAYEHHENSIGQGYPRRLWDMKISPLARIVALADTFCELTLASPTQPNPKTPVQALWHVEAIMGQPFNKDAFKHLKGLMKSGRSEAA